MPNAPAPTKVDDRDVKCLKCGSVFNLRTDHVCETGPILTVLDGPAYHPNGTRQVREERPSDLPGFTVCREVGTGKKIMLTTLYLNRVKAEMAAAQSANPS